MRSYGITNVAPFGSAPTAGAEGDMYYNTTEDKIYVSNGSAWVEVGAFVLHASAHGDGGFDELSLNGSQITSGTISELRIDSAITRDSELDARIANKLTVASSAPGSPATNDLWVDTT